MHAALRWIAVALTAIGLTGCPGFGDQTLAELEGLDDAVTYEGDIKALIEARCYPCHADPPIAGAPNSLASFDAASRFAARMKARAVDEASMPPGNPLAGDERALIEAWVAAGAPQGTPSADMAPDPDLGVADMAPPADMDPVVDMDPGADQGPLPDMGPAPTWNDDVAPIMNQRCAFPGCHGGANPASQLDLTTYQGFVDGGFSGDLTGGGDPAESLFVDRLRARNGFPVMPQGGPMLPEDQIQLIEAWIAAGHPEG